MRREKDKGKVDGYRLMELGNFIEFHIGMIVRPHSLF
jgi:hypothetical protein